MHGRICLSVILLCSPCAWSQAGPAATGMLQDPSEMPMHTPPSVPEGDYSAGHPIENRSNYLRTALTVVPAYDDNLLPDQGVRPIRDAAYSISSMVGFDRTTPRWHEFFTYTPAFTVYRKTSALNSLDHGLVANVSFRMSPHSSVSAHEFFSKSTGVFGPSYTVPPAGSAGYFPQGAIAPWANQVNNSSSADVVYQYSPTRMLGASGGTTQLAYLDHAQAGGLCDSNSQSGSGFYNMRLSTSVYAGATYGYAVFRACPGGLGSTTKTHTVDLFFSYYSDHGFTIAFSGGPQHYTSNLASLPDSRKWTPSVTANLAWQASRTTLMLGYSRTVTGGGGLVGSFRSIDAEATARIQLTQRWTVGAGASYQLQKEVNPLALVSSPGGHAISGTASIARVLRPSVIAEFQYQRLHQTWGISQPSAALPDANRVSLAISYHFDRPLGR